MTAITKTAKKRVNVTEAEIVDGSRPIEEIMKEYGDVILKAFHKNNMTYNSGLNFQNILDIMQKNGDDNSFNMIQKIFLEKIMKNFSQLELSKTQKNEKVDKNKNQKKEQELQNSKYH